MLPTPALSPAMSPTPGVFAEGQGYHCAEAHGMDEDLPKKSGCFPQRIGFQTQHWKIITDKTFRKTLEIKPPGQTFASGGGSEGRQ